MLSSGTVDFAIGERLSKAEFGDSVGVVGLVVGARNDELGRTRRDAPGGGSYPAMVDNGAAARKEILKAGVRNVKGAGGQWPFRRIQADEQTAQFKLA